MKKQFCLFCEEEIIEPRRNLVRKYCNRKCQKDYEQEQRFKLVEMGLIGASQSHHRQIKKYLIAMDGSKCSSCGITEWNNKPIVMDLEHLDGDSSNNTLENCCLLCPNCHSQSPTYKNRNKGKGRASRRQRYKEGKSY